MSNEIRFWFQPTTDRVVLFFVTLFGIFILIRFIKVLYLKSIQRRHEKNLREKIERCQLAGRPEEDLVRELAERYKVRPPDQILSSLQQFDAVASDEIVRIEREPMDLADRLDRIEYLYSIRMNAFSKEPSVGGLERILGPGYKGIQVGEPETETLVREESSPETSTPSENSSESDLPEEPPQEEERETSLSDDEMTSLKALLATEDEEGPSTEGE